MPRTKALPWEKWYPILARFSEWTVLVSISAMALPPIIGIIAVMTGVWYFESKPESKLEEFAFYWGLKRKKNLTKEEEIQLSEYEAGLAILEKPKHDSKSFWIGYGIMMGSMGYLVIKATFLLGTKRWIELVF